MQYEQLASLLDDKQFEQLEVVRRHLLERPEALDKQPAITETVETENG